MKTGKQETVSLLPLVLIGVVIYFMAASGGSKPVEPPAPNPDLTECKPAQPAKPTEAQVWEALAVTVERKSIGGVMQQHTDHVCKVVDELKESGHIADDSRVSDWRAKRVEITDANRQQIADKLRGK